MSSVEDYFSGSTQSAQTSAVAAIDDDPEQAARSVELSDASGVPATAIYGDVDGFERSHKAALSSQIIAGNSYIADYLNSHPMAPRISNDDLGQLDNASRAIGNIPEKSTLQKLHEALGVAKLSEAAFPGDPLRSYKELGLSRPTDLEFAAKHPAMASLLAAGQDLVGFPMVFGSQILSGATNLVNHIAGREAASLLEYGMMRGDIRAPGTGGGGDIEHIAGAMRSAAPWLRAGRDAPIGVHPMLDDLAKQQATVDGKAMKDALSESVKSATRDRAPDYYANFARGQVGDREIGIAADAVRELYGNEPPTADDGKLGFVQDLADQLANAEATGGDIHVPLADWLAKVDPEVADALHDHLRIRPNGITIEEGKVLKEQQTAYHGSPHDFDTFDVSAIGSGEGAQTYGHGLYFAENKAVAQDYQNRLGKSKGNLYKTSINVDPATLLDWDSPLSKQESIFNKIASHDTMGDVQISAGESTGGDFYEALVDHIRGENDKVTERKAQELASKMMHESGIPGIRYLDQGSRGTKTLPQLQANLRAMQKSLDSQERTTIDNVDHQAVVNRLREVVDDLKKQTEEHEKPTRNFVIFNDKDIKITHKNDSPVITEPLPLVRGTAALEPMFSVGDRKLTLDKRPMQESSLNDPAIPADMFDLLDENGNKRGWMRVVPFENGKKLYVDNIGGKKGANMFGPALTRDIARQLKAEYPDAEQVGGFRISGAREKAGTEREVWMKFEDLNDPLKWKGFHEGWTDIQQGVAGEPIEMTPEKQKIVDSVNEVLNRIAPKGVGVEGFERIRTDAGNRVGGVYTRYEDAAPWISWSLESKNPVATARHEAIHFLRDSGRITPDEWSVLSRAAHDGDWVKAHRIDSRFDADRLSNSAKIEESIADQFKKWEQSPEVDSPIGKIFQKIKDILDQIRASLRTAFGKENWEDVFQKIESGEVGEREGKAGEASDALHFEDGRRDIGLNHLGYMLQEDEHGVRSYFDKKEGLREMEGRVMGPKGNWLPSDLQGRKQRWLPVEDKSKFEDIEEDRAPFEKANAIGMTVDQYRRYQKLMERRNAEDLEAAHKSALEYQRKTQTKEWKANRTEMRDQVREELESRPDLALDQLMSQEKLKFHLDAVSDTQREMLPKEYLQKKDGINPDDAAGYFGYHSGDAMVERLGLITRDRQAAGMKAREWLNHLIDTETDRRMQEQFGNLDQNILEDAKEQAISATQLDILHEEVLHLGLKAGSEFPISREQLKQWNKEIFDKTPVGSISTDAYLWTAGKAGRAAEMALLKEDFAEAFREKQRQNNAMIMASYAKAYEKSRRAFDRTAKQFRKREVASVPQEWTNWIHDILQRTGNQVNRSVQDLQENIGRQSEKTLQAFAEAKEAETFGLRETPIADFLLDPTFRASMDSLTAEQFAGLKQSIDVLAKQGRDEKKITVAGETADRDVVLREMREKLKTFPTKALPDERGAISKSMDTPRMFMAGSTAIETIMNRWDRADPRGIFNRYISYPLARAANYKSALQREYAKAYGDLGPIVDGDKLVDAPFPDPLSRSEENPEGRAWPGFTRKHVLAMLQNAGNKSNWRVLARGYSADPEALMAWLHRNTTKEDWDRAQKMGDSVFHSLVSKADTVYENLTGATIEKIPLEPIETPYDTYPGWYHPLMADPIRKEVWVKQEDGTYKRNATGKRGSVMDDSDYFHASTANGYTKRRTGAVYPLDLNFDMVPSRIKQMIHDIAFRDTIIQTEKIFGNKAFQAEVTKHYGPIYTDLLMPYLRGLAGSESIPSKAGAKAAQISETLRQNVISTYIGFNPYTALKHGPTAALMSANEVGPVNFLNAVRSLYGQSPELGLSNSEFALKHSEELQRRERHWQDTIAGQHNEIEGNSSLREKIIEKGSWLVAQSDMLSAKPTWVASYNKNVGEGLSHGESVDLADRAVRRAHGSTAETNQPALVQGGGPLHGWLTSVYGFFGTAMQRRIEIAYQLNDMYQLGKAGEIKAAAAKIPQLTRDIMTYVIWPTAVEEWVTGLNQDDRRGWGRRAIDAGTMGIASSVLYLRDLVHAFTTGQDPGAGLITSPLHDLANTVRDIRKGKEAFNRQHAGKTVGDILTVLGEGTGMSPKIIGNATRFGIDLVNKQVKPKGAAEYFRGITRGTPKLREVK